MTESPLRGKTFYCREWALRKLQHHLDTCSSGQSRGVLITGGPGSGKTALCTEVLWPVSEHGQRSELSTRVLAHHFCQAQDVGTLSVSGFVLSLVRQIERCSLLQGYRDRLEDSAVRTALEPSECERNPDETFKRAVLLPLLDLEPPTQGLLLVVDSIDEGETGREGEWKACERSCTIGDLLSQHRQLLPTWLLLVCTTRRLGPSASHQFPGFRKLCLDDLRRSHVVRDVQQYILSRLDREETLRRHLSRDTAEMLNQLHIKSTGCFLYLERVLNGVLDGFIALREIRHIPGTLYGLYLWLCQRLFTRKLFTRVQPILNVLLAARRPLTPRQLFQAVWSRCGGLTAAEFGQRLEAVARLLRAGPNDTRLLFHHSFAEWLLDVKHCTQRFLCDAAQGHAMLAMGLSLQAPGLGPAEVLELALHLVRSRLQAEPWGLALWMVWCGVPVGGEALACGPPVEQEVIQLLLKAGVYGGGGEPEPGPALLHRALEREDSLRALLESGASVHHQDAGGRTLLASAAHTGNLEVVQLLLARQAELETQDHRGRTPLITAARMGHARVLHCLMAHGADVNHADREGWTALRAAAWGGHAEAVSALLEASSAQVDSADAEGRTALRAAAWGGHEDIALALLRHGADVNRTDREGRTPLIAAAYMGHRQMAEILLQHGARVNHRDCDGRSALSVAALCVPASRGYAGVVGLLLDWGAEVGQRDRDGLSPLLLAALEGHADVVELLLEAGADVEEADGAGRTPLLAAASAGHVAVVSTLLLWGAEVDTVDGEGRTALGVAACQGSARVVRALLDRGLDENHRDHLGWTPLHSACFEGHDAACRALLEQGARVSELDSEGRVPAILAAQEGHGECLRLLLEYGSPLEARGYDGRNTLWAAALAGHGDLVRLLLARGGGAGGSDADGRPLLYLLALDNRLEMVQLLLEAEAAAARPELEAQDAEGRTVLHVGCWQGQLELVRLLLGAGARVDALDRERRSALHSAAWRGHAAVAELLLDKGAAVDHACNQGATGLCIAAQEGHADVVRLLLEKGADPNHADCYGRTPMRVAARRGHTDIMRLLEGYGAPAFNGYPAPEAGPAAPSSPSGSPGSTAGPRHSPASSSSPRSSQASSTGHSLATAQTVPIDRLSFTQQIQQHSLPRSRGRRSSLASPDSTLPGLGPAALSPQPELARTPGTAPVTEEEKRNGTPGNSPVYSPRKVGKGGAGGLARRVRPEPLINITTLDPELNLKQAVKLRFEGPSSGLICKKETPL
ncbi:uncharacterized protein ankrd50l [Mobula birostris]|uniref:uncharacterized protein ankrd50l n=1 Tax=Mobula birostris TaxID=1983395 RepID=UPI003B281AF6